MKIYNYPSANRESMHLPAICKLKITLRKLKKTRTSPKVQYNSLRDDSFSKQMYADMDKGIYKSLEVERDHPKE